MRRLDITVTTQAGCRVVDVAGDVDLITTGQLDQALTRSRIPGRPLVADLLDVGFCDAGGLRALLAANQRGPRWAAPLRIVPSDPVRLVIDLARASEILALFPDRDHALTAGPPRA